MKFIKINYFNEIYNPDNSSFSTYYLKTDYFTSDSFDKVREDEVVSHCCLNTTRISVDIINMNDYVNINITFLNWLNLEDISEETAVSSTDCDLLDSLFDNSFERTTKENFDKNTNMINLVGDGFLVYISITDSTSDYIFNDLKSLDVNYSVLTHKRCIVSAGADSYGEKLILWVIDKLGERIINSLVSKAGEVNVLEVKNINLEKIIDEVAYLANENRNNLSISSIEQLDNGRYSVGFRTQYCSYKVIYSKTHKLINFNAGDKNVTRI